jgi:hypothetical protein
MVGVAYVVPLKVRERTGKVNFLVVPLNGPHRARDYPKKEKLNALVAKESHEGTGSETQARENPLQVRLNAPISEASTELMYVPIEANSCKSLAMMDTGATHNFVAARMVEQLGLKLTKRPSL